MERYKEAMKICTLINNNHLWLLDGFSYLWNKYCGLPVTIFGFDKKPRLASNFEFISLGEQLPAQRWSDGLLMMLDRIEDDYFVLMLEDYWLYEEVDIELINQLTGEFAEFAFDDNILRVDLSGNRGSYKQACIIGKRGYAILGNNNSCLVVETPESTPYQMSFQAAIWHKENMRKVLRKGENPWQSEIEGSERVGNLRVLGTKPAVMKYQPVWRGQQKRWQLDKIKTDDLEFMRRRGWLDVPK